MIPLVLHTPPGHGTSQWEARHSAGEVPDRWLYGLDSLDDGARFHVQSRELRELGHLGRVRSFGRSFVPKKSTRLPPPSGLHFTWDELRAVHMLDQNPDIEACASGAIWCIDEQLRQPLNPKNLVVRNALRRMSLIWCLVDAQIPLVKQWLGESANVKGLTFGIDTSFYKEVPYPDGPLRVLSLGSDRDRDSETLVKSVAQVLSRVPGASAKIQCPPGTILPTGAARLERMNHRDVRAQIAQSHVVVIPTRPNTHFSGMTVALEAMSMGRPVIATATLGAEQYITHGTDGFLVGSGNSAEFAKSILEILKNPGLAQEVGKAAADVVRAKFDSKLMVAAMKENFGALYEPRPSAPVHEYAETCCD
jgi:glycosyltransferase involved in cell wall biosynthesis